MLDHVPSIVLKHVVKGRQEKIEVSSQWNVYTDMHTIYCVCLPPGPVKGAAQLAPVKPTLQEHVPRLLHTWKYQPSLRIRLLSHFVTHPIPRADWAVGISGFTWHSGYLRDRDTALRETGHTIATLSPILHKSRTLNIYVATKQSGEWSE